MGHECTGKVRPDETAPGRSRDDICRASFMNYDLGYFDLETRVNRSMNPFGPKMLPMFWVRCVTHVSRSDRERMARPGRLELPTLCLEGAPYKTLSAASGVACEQTRHLSRS